MSAPDLSSYRAVHAALRSAPHRLAAAARTLDPGDRRRIQALARYWRGFAGEVLAHHTIEDDFFFPALVERVPGTAEMIVRTDADHLHLDELMARCSTAVEQLSRGAAPAVLAMLASDLEALAAHMDEHLAFEDAEILPLFATRFTGDQYQVLEDQAMKSLGVGAQAAFTIPFVLGSVEAAEQAHLMAEAPGIFRVLYRLTRGRHARLERALFGPAEATRATSHVSAPHEGAF